ncbi:hypothetical protein TWF481_009273 [Arthrobotrys musiformis]|uniref:Uncharacterized protein n=1 Tax=Arthrobotrys musiformis TaxID=47236 RepID=A0AAV9W399_9PEZI
MCWLSVQCSCKHNIAIPNPTKACIRPRNPRGCWIIRRGEPLGHACPGCEEYHAPGSEQPSWKDVKRCHDDPIVEWSEINHYDIISMDRARHKNCDSDRLDFMKRLRWKAMISRGLIAGWTLTDRGVMVNSGPDESDDEAREEYREDELMEAIDDDEIQRLLEDPQSNDDGNDIDEKALFGYKLERTSSRSQLAGGSDINGGFNDIEMLFRVSGASDGSSSSSDDSTEAVVGSDESGVMDTCDDQDKYGRIEPLVKLDEMFDQVEAAKPFDPLSAYFQGEQPFWAPGISEYSVGGDPVKQPLFQSTPTSTELDDEQPNAVADPASTNGTARGGSPGHRARIDRALGRMRRMQAAYFEAVNAVGPPQRPSTPTPMDDDEEDPYGRVSSQDIDDTILNLNFN